VNNEEKKKLEDTLNTEVIPVTIADSNLIGVLSKGVGNRFAVASSTNQRELKQLEEIGLKIHKMKEISAVGNLLEVQEKGGIASPLIPKKEKEALEEFFGTELQSRMTAHSELAGACLITTKKGFLVNPNSEPEEMEKIEEIFKVPGMRTTANYGDIFIGNSILANNYGIVAGELTSGPELSRIDEGLHPEIITDR
jgi:translation initiation factor 6